MLRAAICLFSFLWQRQETLWCQLCKGSPSDVKFVCLRLSRWSLSQFARYSTLHYCLLESPPALFIDPKAMLVYVVYSYTFTLEVSRRQAGWGPYPMTRMPSVSSHHPWTSWWCISKLGMIWIYRLVEGLSSHSVLATRGASRCSDAAKITPHYPNETLALVAPPHTHPGLPHRGSALLCSAKGKTLWLQLVLHKMEQGGGWMVC